MREGTIPPNWTDLLQRSSQSGAPENIDLEYTWFTPDLEEDHSENPSHEPSIAPENNNKTLTSLHSKPHVQEIPSRNVASVYEVIIRPDSKGVRRTSNLKKFHLAQQSSNSPSRIPSYEVDKGEKGSKMPKLIDL